MWRCHMGTISDETNRMLKRFGFKPPRLIQNVRTQVRDLDFDRPPCLDSSVTMDRAWQLMRNQKISAIPGHQRGRHAVRHAVRR